MGYTYDHRPGSRTASNSATDDEAEKRDELIGLLSDAQNPAEALVSALDISSDTDLYDAQKHAKEVCNCLSSAEDVAVISDFIGNIQEAKQHIVLLDAALKKAKREAKKEKETIAIEAIEEAIDELREVKREIKHIEKEAAAAVEDLEQLQPIKKYKQDVISALRDAYGGEGWDDVEPEDLGDWVQDRDIDRKSVSQLVSEMLEDGFDPRGTGR